MNFDKLIAIFDADWDESKHPRAKNGQFGTKGSGGSTSASSKEKKKSTMSKSYKALSSGQKADAKAHVASQIKSMSKEKQISVANRVLKAQGKEPIVVNKDGTYTWTNKGERVTTQKPPRIKSDKLARAIVSNGYAVPGIKTGVSAESTKASASAAKTSKTESSSSDSSKPEYLTKKFDTLERHRLVDYKLDKIGDTYMANSHIQGVTLPYTDVQRTIKYLKAMFEGGAKSFEEAIKGLPTHKDGLLNKRNYTFEKIAKGIASTLHKSDNKGSSKEGGITSEQLSAAGRLASQMNEPKKSSVEGFVGAKPLHNQVVKMGKETEFSLNERYAMSQKLLKKASSDYGESMSSKRQDVPKDELSSVTHWLDNVLKNPNTTTLGDAISQLASRNPDSAKVAEGIVSEMFKDPKLADRVSVDPLTKKLTPKDIKNCNIHCENLARSLGIKEARNGSSKLSKSETLNKYYSIGSLIQFKMNSGKYSTYHDLLKDISGDMDKNSKRIATEIVSELGVRNVRYNGK